MAITNSPHYLKRKVLTSSIPKKSLKDVIYSFPSRVYNAMNPLATYVFILLIGLISYELVPFNEEFIAIISIFFAFVTIDKFASKVLHSVFQEEQQTMFLFIIRKSYNAFALSLLQREIELNVSSYRRYKKLLAYSFLFNILFLYNYLDVVMHDEVVLEDILDLNVEENLEDLDYLQENENEEEN